MRRARLVARVLHRLPAPARLRPVKARVARELAIRALAAILTERLEYVVARVRQP